MHIISAKNERDYDRQLTAKSAVSGLLGRIPILGLIIRIVIGIGALVLRIMLMVKAGRSERYKVRWAGNYAEK